MKSQEDSMQGSAQAAYASNKRYESGYWQCSQCQHPSSPSYSAAAVLTAAVVLDHRTNADLCTTR
eukprot:21325-Heterococcus_DN1.PRE.2